MQYLFALQDSEVNPYTLEHDPHAQIVAVSTIQQHTYLVAPCHFATQDEVVLVYQGELFLQMYGGK
ncbi:hypothetical protein D3C77_331490 [compost metagenome]